MDIPHWYRELNCCLGIIRSILEGTGSKHLSNFEKTYGSSKHEVEGPNASWGRKLVYNYAKDLGSWNRKGTRNYLRTDSENI